MKKTLLVLLGLLVFGALTINTACSTDGGDTDDDSSAVADDDSAN